MQSTRRDQVLEKLQLRRAEIPAEVAAVFDKVFHSRTGGLHTFHFKAYPPTIEHMAAAIERYGRDVYLQGVMDGAQAATMQPGIVDFLKEVAQ